MDLTCRVAAGAVEQYERRSGAVGVGGEGDGSGGQSLRRSSACVLGAAWRQSSACVLGTAWRRSSVCVLGACAAPTAASRKGKEAAGGSGRGSSSSGVPSCFAVVLRPQGRKAPGPARAWRRGVRAHFERVSQHVPRGAGGGGRSYTPQSVPKSSHPLGRLQRPLRNARDRTPKPHTPEDDDPHLEPPAASFPRCEQKRHETAAQRQRTKKLLHSG